MKNITPFQLIMLAVFGVAGVIGIITLATFQVDQVPEEERIGEVRIWGTYDGRVVSTWLSRLTEKNENLSGVSYREFSPQDFNTEVLEALAEQRAPHLLLLDNTELFEQSNRLLVLDGDAFPKQTFRTTFLELSEVYIVDEGVLGMPLFADPLVLFWNRTIFQSQGEVAPPATWQDFFRIVPLFTQIGENRVITGTTLPLGEAVNITHFKEIVATLALQAGNPLSLQAGGTYRSVLSGGNSFDSIFEPLQFFTSFSNPTSDTYSWNRSLPTSQEYFLAGKAATYLGFASEIRPLQLKNPNLNFDVAEIPQSGNTQTKSVYARLHGLFIPTQSPNIQDSYKAMVALTSQDALRELQSLVKLSVVRRDLASQVSSDDLFTDIFRREAIYAQTFIDPDPIATANIFGNMIETVTSGRRSIEDAIILSDQEIQVLFNN